MPRSRAWTADGSRNANNIMSSLKRRAFLGAASALAWPAPAIRAQGKTSGVALVIGNSQYRWETSLPNVRRDAPDIAKVFQAMGLKTELVQDAGHAAMRQALDSLHVPNQCLIA